MALTPDVARRGVASGAQCDLQRHGPAEIGQLEARRPQPLRVGGCLLLLPMCLWTWVRGWMEQEEAGQGCTNLWICIHRRLPSSREVVSPFDWSRYSQAKHTEGADKLLNMTVMNAETADYKCKRCWCSWQSAVRAGRASPAPSHVRVEVEERMEGAGGREEAGHGCSNLWICICRRLPSTRGGVAPSLVCGTRAAGVHRLVHNDEPPGKVLEVNTVAHDQADLLHNRVPGEDEGFLRRVCIASTGTRLLAVQNTGICGDGS